jgi:N-methylhydantoinase A
LDRRLGLGVEDLAEGILRVAVARMAGAIRAITVEKGRNPADFVLMPFGGAGPMHGCELAEELGITQVLVPICPGNLSALGLAASDRRQELVRTCLRPLKAVTGNELGGLIRDQEQAGRQLSIVEGLAESRVRFEHAFDMRYARQMFEITVLSPSSRPSPQALREAFLAMYERLYGHADPSGAIEIVNLRSMVVGEVDKPSLAVLAPGGNGAVPQSRRRVRFCGAESEWPVYDRSRLGAGAEFHGPAIIEEANATTVVLPAWRVTVDRWGNLRLAQKGRTQ